LEGGGRLSACPTGQHSRNQLPQGKEIEQLGASRERRLPTGAQVFNLPHKKEKKARYSNIAREEIRKLECQANP